MSPRTSLEVLRLKQLRQLAANLLTGIPVDLSIEASKYWNQHTDDLHAQMSLLLHNYKPLDDKPIDISKECITLSVEIRNDLDLSTLINLGNYSSVRDEIKSANVSPRSQNKITKQVVIVGFGTPVTSAEAAKKIKFLGLRPANLIELLSFGAEYPKFRREKWIIGLGSLFRKKCGNGRMGSQFPIIHGDDLTLDNSSKNWTWEVDTLFLAVHQVRS